MKAFTRKRHSEYSLWVRPFCQTDKDYRASLSLQQNGGRTQAGGALDGGDPDQKPKGRGSRTRKGGSSDGEKGGSKSIVGAGLGTNPTITKQGGRLKATPCCTLCESQGWPLPGQWQQECPHLNASQKAFCSKKKMCLGCLRVKPAPPLQHKCPDWLRERSHPRFSEQCQVHSKLCAAPSSHAASPIPPTFSGAAFWNPRGASQIGQDPVRGNSKRDVAILAHYRNANPGVVPQNRGRLRDPAPLTSVLTVRRGADLMTVGFIFNSGSESSYFHPDMERIGVTRRKKQFQLETLSMGGEVEAVDGLLVGFDVLMASGEVLQLQALKHHGLGKSGTMLRAKVLSVPAEFAAYWNLEQQLGAPPDPTNVNNSIYTRQAQKLMLVIGIDLMHHFPLPIASYRDNHGIVQLTIAPSRDCCWKPATGLSL